MYEMLRTSIAITNPIYSTHINQWGKGVSKFRSEGMARAGEYEVSGIGDIVRVENTVFQKVSGIGNTTSYFLLL